jgi:hypothetical protein
VSFDFIDVAIGIVFVYLVLSLAVTAANELLAAAFSRRALTLRSGIGNLLGKELSGKVYAHPLIRSLYRGKGGPSYMPSRSFAIALLDSLETATQPSLAHDVIAILKRETGGDTDRLRQAIEEWFNDSMERVSGWYKRRTQIVSLCCAIVITIGTNADTLTIASALWKDPTMRTAIVAQAQRYVAEQPQAASATPSQTAAPDAPAPPELPPFDQAQIDFDAASNRLNASLQDLNAMQLPIGWHDQKEAPATPDTEDEDAISGLRLVRDDATEAWPGVIWHAEDRAKWWAALDEHTLGWLITILAISVGAPFWFDMLNKIIAIRSVGKAPVETPKSPRDIPQPRAPGVEP